MSVPGSQGSTWKEFGNLGLEVVQGPFAQRNYQWQSKSESDDAENILHNAILQNWLFEPTEI